jgi:glycerol kinase
MPEHYLAIDAGTTSVRALIFDADWNLAGRAQESLSRITPKPGYVEQSAEELWSKTQEVVKQALGAATLEAVDIAGLGITAQRSCCVIWERATGNALTPMISWQDLRGAERSRELAELGFPLYPATSACKLESALDSIPGGRARMKQGELCWGNVDSFLAFKLSGGVLHVTDPSQACATGYLDIETVDWASALIDAQDLDRSMFPTLVDTAALHGTTAVEIFGAAIPINAIVGDQQSAAIAQGCTKTGDLKFTFGTSGTCNVHTESEIVMIPGTYPLILRQQSGRTDYCVEAMIITAGATLDWLSATLGVNGLSEDIDSFLNGTDSSENALVLPALQGLGSPHARPDVTGQIAGLTLSTTPRNIVYAALEGIAFRARDILEHIGASTAMPDIETIRVDGGLTMSCTFTRILADATQKPVAVCRHPEATALGAARLARLVDAGDAIEIDQAIHSQVIEPDTAKRDYYNDLYVNWRDQFHLSDESY